MNIRPGTRLQIGPHVIEVRRIAECYTLTDAVCVDVVDIDGHEWGIYFFGSGRIEGKSQDRFSEPVWSNVEELPGLCQKP